MAEIRQKHFFYLWEDKGVAGGVRTDVNQQKHTKRLKLKVDQKSCQYDDNCNNNYYFSDIKEKK